MAMAFTKSLYIVAVVYCHKPIVGQKKATKTRDYMKIFRGQGATEYLVLLAVVLIVALVSVALLGFFPGMAADARITQSQAYWRGQARPFAIEEASVASTTNTMGYFTVQNMEANGPYTINASGFNVGFCNGTGNSSGASETVFGAGETKTITLICDPPASVASGAIYDLAVNIIYTTPSNIPSTQWGNKNLVGRYT